MPEELVPHWGNYKKLLSFQKAECIYDLTYYFCRNFLRKNDRTVDQMIQAARSGKQNIVEGSAAASTSREMEIKLLNVAKASLHELLADYEDFLRSRSHRQWEENSVELLKMRELGRTETTLHFLCALRPPVRRKPSPIWQSSSLNRRIICFFAKFNARAQNFSSTAACGNASPLPPISLLITHFLLKHVLLFKLLIFYPTLLPIRRRQLKKKPTEFPIRWASFVER